MFLKDNCGGRRGHCFESIAAVEGLLCRGAEGMSKYAGPDLDLNIYTDNFSKKP